MAAQIFDGKQFASEREKVLQRRISELGFVPKLVSVFFAEDPGSVLYTNLKQKAAQRVGIAFHAEEVSIMDDVDTVLRLIKNHSNDSKVHGLMVQKPAKAIFFEQPDTGWAGAGLMDTMVKNLKYFVTAGRVGVGTDAWWKRLTVEIRPSKDVDCLRRVSLDRVYRGRWRILPATVRAIMGILESVSARRGLAEKRVVVVGRSEIVGKPLAHVLAQKGAKVTLCASTGVVAKSLGSRLVKEHKPLDLASAVSEADVVISATGKPGIITGEMVKRGAVVVDVGAPVGDVDFDRVKKKASFITPVPGGVGPVTVVSLMENLLDLI
ncbi:bifunctional 5,10-methylenetetrahydrofolate dehydrogenase/5,10-methenyltetrahydrofolate cyclohydrolase [Patescibacteria group bacterium]|nr:bifunctional 5,10-methylenetetrahydrofolate dehydrogenase/5,10-methenyltetrahydrofolate cyclohydrolase [Patescibacteria group bacterium]